MNAPQFDPTTLEVLWTRLRSVTDEAAKVIVRTSFSTLSNEANDFACVLTDARGRSLAQNTAAIPSFIGCLPAAVRHFLERMGTDRMRPPMSGTCDVVAANATRRPARNTGFTSEMSLRCPVPIHGLLVM